MDASGFSSCLDTLLNALRNLSGLPSIQRTLNELCTHVAQYFQAKHFAVLLVEPDSRELVFSEVVGTKRELLEGKRLRKGKGIAGWVAETDTSLLVEDTGEDPRFKTQWLTAKTQDVTSIMAVPLRSGDLVYAVMEVMDSYRGVTFTPDNLKELESIANLASLALERVYYFRAMKRLSETDTLTGLPNRRCFLRHMHSEIERCGRYNIPSSVLILTLDNLRDINAEHGMRMGDKLLKILGSILLSESRKADLPCRIGAKQLAVIMPNTGEAAAREAKERVNIKIASECAARDIANLSLTLDVRSGTRENFSALLSIPGVNKPQESEFRKLRSMAGNLFSLLNEEKQTTERRQHYRKSVRLAGRYEDPDNQEAGDILLENLSLNGAAFTTMLYHTLTRNRLVKMHFRLDDSKRTEIIRLAQVKYARDRYVGCQFVDQKSYDSDLGFYLMR